MRYYSVTSTKNGEPYALKMENTSEWSLKGMRRVMAEHGVELHETHRYSIPDKPMYRKPTDEERAEGVTGFLINNIKAVDY